MPQNAPGATVTGTTNTMGDYLNSIAFQELQRQGYNLGDLGAGAANKTGQWTVSRPAYSLVQGDQNTATGMDALLTGNGGLAYGYINPSWTGLQRVLPPEPPPPPAPVAPPPPAPQPSLGYGRPDRGPETRYAI